MLGLLTNDEEWKCKLAQSTYFLQIMLKLIITLIVVEYMQDYPDKKQVEVDVHRSLYSYQHTQSWSKEQR